MIFQYTRESQSTTRTSRRASSKDLFFRGVTRPMPFQPGKHLMSKMDRASSFMS